MKKIFFVFALVSMLAAGCSKNTSEVKNIDTAPVVTPTTVEVTATPVLTPTPTSTQASKPTVTPTPSPTQASGPKTYTMAEVSVANSKDKCWSVVSEKVYDLTKWISLHPGGQGAITSICGKDGTAAFNSEHMGESKPANVLTKYYIGELK